MVNNRLILSLALGVLFLSYVGCAELSKYTKKEAPEAEGKKVETVAPRYSEFKDVKVAPAMELDRNESVVYESRGLRMGVLYYSGRAEPHEVVDSFKKNMKKDGWDLINSFRHKTYILNFAKSDRNCIIIVAKKGAKANVQIWMGPLEKKVKSKRTKRRRK